MFGLITRRFGLTIVTILIAISLLLISLPLNTEAAGLTPDTPPSPVTAGSISGHVYHTDGVSPISGAGIIAYPSPMGSNPVIKTAKTNSDGSYIINGLAPGSYIVSAYADGYQDKFYDNSYSINEAKPVVVTASDDTPNIDVKLEEIGSISGHIYQADGKTPIPSIEVKACLIPPTLPFSSAYTATDGSYTIKGLIPGNYWLCATSDGYVSQYYHEGAPVAVRVNCDTPNIDFSLEALVPIKVGITVPASVQAGGDFVAIINVTEVINLCALQFDVSYDPAVLQVTGVTSGMIGSTTMPVEMWGFIPPDTPGKIRVLGHILGLPHIRGSGYLAGIHFHVIGSHGQRSNLIYSSGLFIDVLDERISPVTWENGSIQVSNRLGDVNGDGQVTMGDITKLERIILGLDHSTPAADVNNDGQINTGDITKIERIILGME